MKYTSFEPPLKIILADDDPDDRDFFREAITAVKVRHEYLSFEDGGALMDYVAGSGPEYPHLIFLDLNMPKKNGMECLKELRSDDKYKGIVIVIYSTSSAAGDIEATFLAGANIYITKPNSIDKLKLLIADVISVNWQYHTSRLNKENFVMVR